jgi:hypothetical protein
VFRSHVRQAVRTLKVPLSRQWTSSILLSAMCWKAIGWGTSCADFTVWVTPFSNVAVVVEPTVLAFVSVALFVLMGVLQVVMDLDTLEVAVVVLAATISGLPVPVYRPEYVVTVMTVKGKGRHRHRLKFPGLRHNCHLALLLALGMT